MADKALKTHLLLPLTVVEWATDQEKEELISGYVFLNLENPSTQEESANANISESD